MIPWFHRSVIPCLLFEDEHLLVVNKPAGWNTHAPNPYAGEGIYDWLRHREPRWAKLAIIHRLDKETSGVLVFGKTPLANRSLTEQFASRAVRKKYLLLTDREPKQHEFTAKSKIIRVGERYASGTNGEAAETRFQIRNPKSEIQDQNEPSYIICYELEAEPLTGRTHQIRVHAAENGFPILGDVLYGGRPFQRVCLHASELRLRHPSSGEGMEFKAAADFSADARLALRQAMIEPESTDAFRLIHGASDGEPAWYVDRLGEFLLSQSERGLTEDQRLHLATLCHVKAAYHKILNRQIRGRNVNEASPRLVAGEAAPARFSICENGIKFELSFEEGCSVGLFLDQRDNRRRFLTGHVAAGFPLFNSGIRPAATARRHGENPKPEILNAFAYTCGYSVCAAKAGARTTSLDLSKKYLEWGKQNFALNDLNPADHDFIYGDVFDWLKRLAKKGRKFDVVVLDPPTFSQSKQHGTFRVEKDYGKLVALALPLTKLGGVLFASTNAVSWPPEKFIAVAEASVHAVKRSIGQRHYAPQPPDFPVSRSEPAYLKTLWLRVD